MTVIASTPLDRHGAPQRPRKKPSTDPYPWPVEMLLTRRRVPAQRLS
jgi:hypothetical protein